MATLEKSKSKVIIYYNRGTKCCLRMLVSMWSLRKYGKWTGDIILLAEGKQSKWFLEKCKSLDVEVRDVPPSGEYPLTIKPKLYQYVNDYKMVMFLDADTLVIKPVDAYFDLIERYGFVTGNFSNWKTSGSSMSRRIKRWEPAVPELIEPALKYGTAVNTGVNGWKTGNPALAEWDRVCQLGYRKKCERRIVDEIACQLILPHVEHGIAGVEWGLSVKFGKVEENTKIIHYHGHKHVGKYRNCKYWKDTYREMVKEGFIGETHKSFYDRSVAKWLNGDKEIIPVACTLVTAVNEKYLKRFKSNYQLWKDMDYVGELPLLIFVHEDCWDDQIWQDLNKEWEGKVRTVKWKFPLADSMREEMLSAFVFGVVDNVKTKYWIKLDCDCTPKSNKLEIDSSAWKSTLCAKAWGYTKVKGDPQYEEDGVHWLKRLDEWANQLEDFDGTDPLFEGVEMESVRHSHKRICSFFAIEKTLWTKHLADMCRRSRIKHNKLPIPSQDTLTWYGITRLGGKRSIVTQNFKKYFKT